MNLDVYTRVGVYLAFISLFWLAVYIIAKTLKLDKKNLYVKPFIIIYKTAKFNKLLENMSSKYKESWRYYSTLSVFLAFGLLLFSTYTLTGNIFKLLVKSEEAVGLVPILPGVTIGFEPLLYILPAILIGLTTHEIMHGVVAKLENIPIESSGILVAFLIFGGFVEPNEEAFRKSESISKFRILSSGPSANLTVAFITLILLNVLFQQPQGLLVYSVSPDSPLYKLGLDSWSIVSEINGVKLGLTKPSIPFITPYQNPLKELNRLNITDNVIVKTDKGVFNISLVEFNRSLNVRFYVYPYSPSIFGDLIPRPVTFTGYLILMYMCNINVAFAIFNMLPVYPLDGYGFADVFLSKIKNHTLRKTVTICLNAFALSLLILNMGLTFLRFRILS
ncbi:site-2 protease family protein [Candidatus Bathyarchaeota archaeon]|nr:site-2 protease family protein [Candidatus Bathyarchaeota archaeon]MBS7613170.1 site-2 protease family protein [Candidatus Bathyarchaeota archaeon]MBS7617615.1 site-2 protease family protein [Candidatus Bathyarchaeota archaeon]